MFDCLNQKATQSGFAKLVGTSKQAISERARSGQLKAEGTYAEWLNSYLEKLREEAAGRSEKLVAEIRARKELAQARREELELAKELKLVVATGDLGPALVGLIKEIQSSVMEAGTKSLHAIEAEYSLQIDDDVILGSLRTALRNIAGGGDQLVSSITGKPFASMSAAVDADQGMDREKHQAAGGE